MQKITLSVLSASVVFFLLMLGIDVLFRGNPLNSETLMTNVFKTIIFAMIFAAIKVASIMFKKDKSE